MAIVRLDKLQAVYAGNIESVVAETDLMNGSHVVIGGLAGMGGEVVEASAPTDVTEQEVLLVASPELLYDERESIADFVNKKGVCARAYHYTVGDIVTVTDDMIEGTSVVNQYLVPANGKVKLQAVAEPSDEAKPKFVATVIAKEKIHGQDATVYRVVSC